MCNCHPQFARENPYTVTLNGNFEGLLSPTELEQSSGLYSTSDMELCSYSIWFMHKHRIGNSSATLSPNVASL